MNINSMKGILGDAVSNEVRSLELRIGQIVRGVVLQQLPNNEATVSINGVQVRAKLEIPLMEGQASLLQVQPDSTSGQIHLKQVDPTSLGLQDPMKDILKSLNLPDRAWAQELIKDLRREGFALNKETAAAFQRAAQLMPAGVSQEQWMNAAAAVFKRGLPMSESTISAMHQLQNGTPIHALLSQLRGELTQLLQNNSHPHLQQLLTQLSNQLDKGADLLRQLAGGTTNSSNPQAAQAQQATAQLGNNAQASLTGTAAASAGNASPAASQASSTIGTAAAQGTVNQQGAASTLQQLPVQEGISQQPSAMTPGNQGTSGQQLLPQLMKWLGVNHEALLARTLLSQSAASNSQTATMHPQSTASQQGTALPNQSMAQATMTAGSPSSLTAQGTVSAGPTVPQAAQGAVAAGASTPLAQPSTAAGAQLQQPTAAAGNLNHSSSQFTAAATQATVQTGGNGAPIATNSATQFQGMVQQNAAIPIQGDGGTAANSGGTVANAQAAANAASAPATAAQGNMSILNQAQAQVQQQATTQAGQTAALPTMPSELTATQAAAGHSNSAIAQESLKATIMQLIQASDVPSGLRDAAQQLLHAITGQQLMMSAERNHSVFSHVTFFIPIQDGENGQTASIHVQTRRNRKGELDADNCRIVFDLQMKTIGPTLVDMNIMNKIVSLNLWNDHPAIAPIMDVLKPDIQEALQGYGYLLSSVRATPIPLKEQEVVIKTEESKNVIVPPDIEQLNSTRYKGVDFKI